MKKSKMDVFDFPINNRGWCIGVCGFRFGGMFAFLVPDSDIFKDFEYQLQGASGDITNVEFQDYISEDGAWLPVSYGKSYQEVIEKLVQKIPSEIYLEPWLHKSEIAFKAILEMIYHPYHLSAALDNKDQRLFYKTSEK